MKGLNEIELKNLSIVPRNRDTLLTLHTLNMHLNFWKLIRGKIEVRNVTVDQLKASFIKADSMANYDFLFLKSSDRLCPQNKPDTESFLWLPAGKRDLVSNRHY